MIGKPIRYGLLITLGLFVNSSVNATNGYFAHGYGTKNKGLAGGGVALPQDAMISATNPAGLVFVEERLDLGVGLFSPVRSYSVTADTAGVPDGAACGANCPFTIGGNATSQSIDSENELFLIPHFAMNWALGAQAGVGVSLYGNGGMNSEYQGGQAQHNNGLGTAVTTPGTFGAGTAGVNLEQLFLNATYSRKMSANSSWGASAIAAYQRFEATGLATFGGFSTDATNLSNNGVDDSFGVGWKLGIQGEILRGLTLAASYQSKIDMSEFDKYKGLFAENGDFDVPATWTAGLAFTATPNNVVTFDVQRIEYSDVAAIANPMNNLISTSGCIGGNTSYCLGGANGGGFGWRDMTIYKLGWQWAATQNWTIRAGYNHGKQPIAASEVVFNILAPAVIEDTVTLGFTWDVSKTSEINFSFMHGFEKTVTGANPLNPTQEISITMYQNEAEMSWGWKF
ncbi:putative facilitator of salicylate uptake [hydrothermal vent metagenome]|uniref:Putative facilitator of salicylate uptake n=1 Tax=hydrothermal vent metagenome TaxID=652676 RepID=A0A3B0ZNF9_9ZZZZ